MLKLLTYFSMRNERLRLGTACVSCPNPHRQPPERSENLVGLLEFTLQPIPVTKSQSETFGTIPLDGGHSGDIR
jgi:hypothetical protein